MYKGQTALEYELHADTRLASFLLSFFYLVLMIVLLLSHPSYRNIPHQPELIWKSLNFVLNVV